MVVDAEGRLVSAREVHGLFSVVPTPRETSAEVDDGLRLRAPGLPGPAPATGDAACEEVPVRLHRHDLTGALVSPEADAWVMRSLGRPGLRLVRCVDPTRPARSTRRTARAATTRHTRTGIR